MTLTNEQLLEILKSTLKIDSGGNKYWLHNGEIHRINGPAVEYVDGGQMWFLNGQRHRIDGPAVEYADGTKYWFINGMLYSEEEFKKKAISLINTVDL